MALYSYDRFNKKHKNFRAFYIALRETLQSYYGNAPSGYLMGNWSKEAKAFDQLVSLYHPNRNDPITMIELRDKTCEFANSLQSTYHWAASAFIGSWAADLISTPVGGGGSTLKQSLEKVLTEYQDLFTRAEESIKQANELEAARQQAEAAHKAAQAATLAYHQQRAQQYRH